MEKKDNDKKESFSKKIIVLLKKNLTWTIIGVFATLLSPFVYDYCSSSPLSSRKANDEIDSLRICVLEKIDYIEKNFHPKEIPSDLDTNKYYDIAKIREFQVNALEYSKMWKFVDNETQLSTLDSKDYDRILSIAGDRLFKYFNLYGLEFQIVGNITELYVYGKNNNISFYIFDEPRFSHVINSWGYSNESESEELKTLCDELVKLEEKYEIVKPYDIYNGKELPEEIKEVLSRMQILEGEIYHTKDKYKSDLHFLEEVIKLNDQYSIGVNRFKLGTYEGTFSNQEVSDTL